MISTPAPPQRPISPDGRMPLARARTCASRTELRRPGSSVVIFTLADFWPAGSSPYSMYWCASDRAMSSRNGFSETGSPVPLINASPPVSSATFARLFCACHTGKKWLPR